MHEKLIDSFIATISERFSTEDLKYIQRNLMVKLNDYELTERCTDVAVMDEIPEAVKVYLVSLKIQGRSDGTLKLYAGRIKTFFQYCRKPLTEITATDIKIFLFSYQQEHGISNRTLDDMRVCICSFMKWCVCEEYIYKDPTRSIKPIKYESKVREYLSEEEMEILRSFCNNKRDTALIEFLYSTGCRVSEVVALNKSDVNLSKLEVVVTGKGNKQRKVYINARCKIALQNYFASRKDNNEALFVTNIRPYKRLAVSGMERVMRELGTKTGINKGIHPHMIRHTTASHAIQHGMPVENVRQILGHESLDTTMIYAHINDFDVKMSHKRCIV